MSMPIWPSARRHARKSILRSGPPRFRFHPRSRPPHLPASMMRSRRNSIFAWRCPSDPTGARLSAYLALTHATIAGPLLEAHDPPGGVGPGPGVGAGGAGVGAAPVWNVWVAAHALNVSPSPARARQ